MKGNRQEGFLGTRRRVQSDAQAPKQFEQLEASALYCPRCKRAVPVRKRLLLVLPTQGDKYEYLCAHCATSVGTKMEETTQKITLIHT